MGPRLCHLIRSYWDQQCVVPCQSGFYGSVIKPSHGLVQGSIFSPTGCLLKFDKAYRYWLTYVVDDNGCLAREGFGQSITKYLLLGYADDTFLSGRNPTWLQNALDLFVDTL